MLAKKYNWFYVQIESDYDVCLEKVAYGKDYVPFINGTKCGNHITEFYVHALSGR